MNISTLILINALILCLPTLSIHVLGDPNISIRQCWCLCIWMFSSVFACLWVFYLQIVHSLSFKMLEYLCAYDTGFIPPPPSPIYSQFFWVIEKSLTMSCRCLYISVSICLLAFSCFRIHCVNHDWDNSLLQAPDVSVVSCGILAPWMEVAAPRGCLRFMSWCSLVKYEATEDFFFTCVLKTSLFWSI